VSPEAARRDRALQVAGDVDIDAAEVAKLIEMDRAGAG
jgi:hypothetical protein